MLAENEWGIDVIGNGVAGVSGLCKQSLQEKGIGILRVAGINELGTNWLQCCFSLGMQLGIRNNNPGTKLARKT